MAMTGGLDVSGLSGAFLMCANAVSQRYISATSDQELDLFPVSMQSTRNDTLRN
jgi:hypothetical protein